MKKFIVPSLFALCLCTLSFAQIRSPKIEALLREDPTRAGVNTHSYEFCEIKDTKAPKGYKPFYISHYGRHGARSDWGYKNYARLEKVLTQAKKEGILTASGDSLLNETKQVIAYTNGMNGRLTPKGIREHQKLAERMYHRYPRVFKKESRNINAISSIVPRCIVSMTGFTCKLIDLDRKLNITWDTGEKYFEYLNNDCTREMRKGTQHILDSILTTYPLDSTYTCKILFTDQKRAHEIVPSVATLERDIYETGRVADPFDMDVNIFRFISFDALYKWYDFYNMELFIRQCNSVEYGMQRMPLTEPLINDMVTRADDAIKNGNIAVELRFGHDYPTIAMASYLGFKGIGDRLTIQEAQKEWCGGLNVCFAENIQLIFYKKSESDPILVKFLFNEKETTLRGLEPVTGPYYDWEVVKKNLKGYLR